MLKVTSIAILCECSERLFSTKCLNMQDVEYVLFTQMTRQTGGIRYIKQIKQYFSINNSTGDRLSNIGSSPSHKKTLEHSSSTFKNNMFVQVDPVVNAFKRWVSN